MAKSWSKNSRPLTYNYSRKAGHKIFLMHKGKEISGKVSGSRTKITIAGKKCKRKAITAGMSCTFIYLRPGAEAKEVNCI